MNENLGKLGDQAGATVAGVVASIKKVTEIVAEITLASREQSSGINQIGGAILHLDKMTQQNAILVESSLTGTQKLEDQARGLVGVVQVFKLDHAQEVKRAVTTTAAGHGRGESRGTAKEAVALVKRAIEFRKTCSSRDAYLHGLSDRASKFYDRDMYVFALDDHGKYLAFGGNPAKVGSRVQDIPGVDGAGLSRAIIAQCKDGPGWVGYEIVNAATNKVQSKMSYVELVDGDYVGCGVYTSLT